MRGLPIPRKVLGGKRLYDRLELEAYADSLSTEGEVKANSCDGAFGIT
ncbi:Hypothetical Protein RSKD131_0386 [Cereibacter sphaeroides KD131]|nr:Hypothetical Protein RSKD131_0386 [Cereibacter sphaeroides KD131]